MTDKKKAVELNEEDLDHVVGGTGSKGLLAHELTHVQQQEGGKSAFAKSDNPDGIGKSAKGSILAQGGDGGI